MTQQAWTPSMVGSWGDYEIYQEDGVTQVRRRQAPPHRSRPSYAFAAHQLTDPAAAGASSLGETLGTLLRQIWDTSLIFQVGDQWRGAFKALSALRSKYANTEAAISDEAFGSATFWLIRVFQTRSPMDVPDVTINGEGGVDLEWQLEDRFVSIQIGKDDTKPSVLYVEAGDTHESLELLPDNLTRAFIALV